MGRNIENITSFGSLECWHGEEVILVWDLGWGDSQLWYSDGVVFKLWSRG